MIRLLMVLAVLWLSSVGGAKAQISCTVKSQLDLLYSFADNVGVGRITPQTMRDFVCSVPDLVNGGGTGTLATSTVLSGAAIGLGNGVPTDITSMVLGVGMWDCSGSVGFTANAATYTATVAWVSQTSAAFPIETGSGGASSFTWGGIAGWTDIAAVVQPTGTVQEVLTVPTRVYLGAASDFSAGTMSGWGYLRCRKIQ